LESKPLTLSSSSGHGYELAYQLAAEKLAGTSDIQRLCRQSGTEYVDAERAIIIKFLNETYQVTLPEIAITSKDKDEEVILRDKILIVHYLATAKGTLLANKLIAYKELPEGTTYYPTFYQRSIKPLASHFGNEPQRLVDAASLMGGRSVDYGDAAVTVDVFPRVPLTMVAWRGDDEFDPEGNILFDNTISDYLPVEDIIVVSESAVRRLIKLDKQRQ
jgi:hypothetical protein